jgi:outer membrane receptor protein involved in Fe transport
MGLLAIASSLLATALPFTNAAKVSLTGTIMADETSPLEYATVSAYTTDTILLDGTVTDAAGKFELTLPKGDYKLRIEFIGFATKDVPVSLRKQTDLGAISLSEGGIDLGTVEVRADKSEMVLKLDKKVFNVGKDALAAGGSANQILEQIPSVTVSADGAVALRGDAGVTILINGRPSALAENGALSSISASSIERVEVITNPSAKYEAAGTAGILNIILKKENNRGYGGNVSIGTGFPDNHTLDVNVNFRGEKFNAFANVGGRYSNFNGSGVLTRTSTLDDDNSNLRRVTDQLRNDLAGSGFFGVDYNVSPTETLSASYAIYHMRNDDESVIDFAYNDPSSAPAAAPERALVQTTEHLEPGTYNQVDLSYGKNFATEGRKLNVYFKNDFWKEPEYDEIALNQRIPMTEELYRYRTVSDEGSTDYMVQIDYESPLGEGSSFEIGARAETRIITSDYNAEIANESGFEPIPGFTNDFDYFERIGAAYGQYAFRAEKFSLQAGLRTEFTAVSTKDELESTEELKKDYLNLFPSLSLQYTLSETTSSQLSYGRRIRRPSFGMINPFGGIGDPTSLYIGNPDINPIYIDRVEWNLLYRKGKLTLNPAVYATRVKDFFKYVVEQRTGNLFGLDQGTIVTSPVNLGNEDLLGVELTANYQVSEALSLSGEFNYYGFRETGMLEGRDFAASGGTWSSSIRASLNLPKDIRFQGSYRYSAARQDAQAIDKAQYYANFSLSKEWKDKYTVSANVRSRRFFNSESFRPTFTETEEFQWTGWRFAMTFRYRFEKGAGAEQRRNRGSIR